MFHLSDIRKDSPLLNLPLVLLSPGNGWYKETLEWNPGMMEMKKGVINNFSCCEEGVQVSIEKTPTFDVRNSFLVNKTHKVCINLSSGFCVKGLDFEISPFPILVATDNPTMVVLKEMFPGFYGLWRNCELFVTDEKPSYCSLLNLEESADYKNNVSSKISAPISQDNTYDSSMDTVTPVGSLTNSSSDVNSQPNFIQRTIKCLLGKLPRDSSYDKEFKESLLNKNKCETKVEIDIQLPVEKSTIGEWGPDSDTDNCSDTDAEQDPDSDTEYPPMPPLEDFLPKPTHLLTPISPDTAKSFSSGKKRFSEDIKALYTDPNLLGKTKINGISLMFINSPFAKECGFWKEMIMNCITEYGPILNLYNRKSGKLSRIFYDQSFKSGRGAWKMIRYRGKSGYFASKDFENVFLHWKLRMENYVPIISASTESEPLSYINIYEENLSLSERVKGLVYINSNIFHNLTKTVIKPIRKSKKGKRPVTSDPGTVKKKKTEKV